MKGGRGGDGKKRHEGDVGREVIDTGPIVGVSPRIFGSFLQTLSTHLCVVWY